VSVSELQSGKSWPWLEARKILNKIEHKIPKKGYVLFGSGYGPSGMPHIGTFGEVLRTSFVRHAFKILAPNIPTRLFVISDDLDGMRKIPENIPDRELLEPYIGKPLTSIPDPFGTHESYGHNMNSRLRAFLDKFDFEYEFISATDYYKDGIFNEYLIRAAERYDDLMQIMLPTLGAERQSTYSPFMPIDPDTGKVIADGVVSIDPDTKIIKYLDEFGKEKKSTFVNGGCKLQWKCDFGMRWAALDVDYELYGKDHYPNEQIYRAICKALGKEPPVNFFYEMFLDENGAKISKSKGNGLTIDEWLTYSVRESLAYYMFQKPKTAKKLYFDVIPKATDEYLSYLKKYHENTTESNLDNPVFFIHHNTIPHRSVDISCGLLLNLASACNPDNENILWGFILKHSDYQRGKSQLLDQLVTCTVRYYNDYICANKKYRAPTDIENEALKNFRNELNGIDRNTLDIATVVQNLAYSVAHNNNIETKAWFISIYQVLLGLDSGPRVGSFVELYGIDNMIALIDSKITQM